MINPGFLFTQSLICKLLGLEADRYRNPKTLDWSETCRSAANLRKLLKEFEEELFLSKPQF